MDPPAICASAGSLIGFCTNIDFQLNSFIQDSNNAADTIERFVSEISSLSSILSSIKATFESEIFSTLQLGSLTGYEDQHWGDVNTTLLDCAKVLEELHDT